jgi:hypothetical protein
MESVAVKPFSWVLTRPGGQENICEDREKSGKIALTR